MKKLLLSLVTVFLLFACNNENMEEKNNENKQGYLTITYHSEGHTSGEVPVDNTKYPIVYAYSDMGIQWYAAERVPILHRGTLEKEGYAFLGWTEDPELGENTGSFIPIPHSEKRVNDFYFMSGSDQSLKLHAVWYKRRTLTQA